VHLALNSITIIYTFVHLCEAYLGIAPHFHLWRHFFELKKTGKGVVIGSVGFMLRRNVKSKYINLTLPDNTTDWKQGWFYLDNPTPALKERTGRVPIPYSEWTNQLAPRDNEDLKPLLDDLEQLKAEGLTGAAVAISFCRRCWGVTRKIRMVPLTRERERERERERVLSTFKHRIGTQGDNGSPSRWHKFQKSESVYTCPRAPFYWEMKGLLHS
jgi:hypothetical protein